MSEERLYGRGNIKNKSMNFAIRIVNLYNFLNETKQERIMSKQILRSGTSVGANIREGQFAESPADFIHKYSVAQRNVQKPYTGSNC